MAAARALSRRDLSARRLGERLEHHGIPPAVARETLASLARAGLVDDARFAAERARSLAERRYGDAAIEARLEADGVEHEHVRAALAALPPERERAKSAVGAREEAPRAARRLAARGFSPEAIEEALAGWTETGAPG